jgi:GNAT superfamily N-acetyltransferase
MAKPEEEAQSWSAPIRCDTESRGLQPSAEKVSHGAASLLENRSSRRPFPRNSFPADSLSWVSLAEAGQLLEPMPSMLQNKQMPIELRPAFDHDFEYCRRLYFGEMLWIIDELHLDRTAQETSFRQQWNPTQVRIIALDTTDVGWLQAITQDDELFVAQMVVDGPFQRRGICTEVLKRLIVEATEFNLAVRLNVVRINPARRLYERLGFRVTHEDDRKFYMKRDRDVA